MVRTNIQCMTVVIKIRTSAQIVTFHLYVMKEVCFLLTLFVYVFWGFCILQSKVLKMPFYVPIHCHHTPSDLCLGDSDTTKTK